MKGITSQRGKRLCTFTSLLIGARWKLVCIITAAFNTTSYRFATCICQTVKYIQAPPTLSHYGFRAKPSPAT